MSDLHRRMAALYERKVVQPLEAAVRRTALDLQGTLKVRTPVATGRARANWFLDVGAPVVRIVEPNQGQTEQAAAATAATYRLSAGAIYVSNNVPYIRRLNDGHSQQAPAGFVEDSISIARTRAKRRVR